MYTGTLISDLMAAVEMAEQKIERQRMSCEAELHAIFAMQIPVTQADPILMGAA